ncbi:DUF317 domain-containing protein [Streptomyces sp. NPDC054919]
MSEQTIVYATGRLIDSGWKQTVNGRWIKSSPPNEDAVGIQFDAFAAQALGSTLPTWVIWGGDTADRPDWALHASPRTPAFVLQAPTFELADDQGRHGIPAKHKSDRPAAYAAARTRIACTAPGCQPSPYTLTSTSAPRTPSCTGQKASRCP